MRIIAIAVGVAVVAVALGIAFALGVRSRPVPPPVEVLSQPIPTPTHAAVSEAPTPAPPIDAATPPMTDGEIASSIATLSGEPLIAALWAIDQRAAGQPTYAQLQRNADRYAGNVAVFTGEVLEIQDVPQGSGSFLRLAVQDDSDRVLAVFALAEPDDSITQGHHVRVYGTLDGTFEYDSQAGWHIAIPRLNAVAVVPTSVPRRAPRFQ